MVFIINARKKAIQKHNKFPIYKKFPIIRIKYFKDFDWKIYSVAYKSDGKCGKQ